MKIQKLNTVYFSPSGTTKTVVEKVADVFSMECNAVDILKKPLAEPMDFPSQELVIVGMPVFGGRIPKLCTSQLQLLRGDNTLAIALVAFGNREYEDALLELTDCLEAQGFNVIGAGAFVAQHSIFNQVGKNRPDTQDVEIIDTFARKCKEKIENHEKEPMDKLKVKGNVPYREFGGVPLQPKGDAKCNNCGSCVKLCPVGAIEAENPRKTDKEKCISCTACIAICPQGARNFSGIVYKLAAGKFEKKCSERKEPEYFI